MGAKLKSENTSRKLTHNRLDSMFVEILAEKKRLCSSLLRWIQVAANKTYCLLCLPQTILCEWMKLGLVTEKDHFIIYLLPRNVKWMNSDHTLPINWYLSTIRRMSTSANYIDPTKSTSNNHSINLSRLYQILEYLVFHIITGSIFNFKQYHGVNIRTIP